MGPKKATKGRARRTHSLGGCLTCRRRHTKCDQVQPSCLTCKAVGITCEGYVSSVQWVSAAGSSASNVIKPDVTATRRHLFSEESRASMSSELAAKFSSNSVDDSLTEIDSWSKNNHASHLDNLAVGPFSVLNFNTPTLTSVEQGSIAQSSDAQRPLTSDSGRSEQIVNQTFEDVLPTPSTLDPLMSLDDSLQWADLFALDFGNEIFMQNDPIVSSNQHLAPPVYDDSIVNDVQEQFIPHKDHNSTIAPKNALQPEDGVNLGPISPLVDTSAPSTDLLGDIHMLLHNFQDKVIDAMAGVPWTDKSPWKTMNLTRAIQTLADMTFLDAKTVNHACAANLYSILCSSARQMAAVCTYSPVNTRPAEQLEAFADWALEKAKFHLKHSMSKEFNGSSQAKYKDQLMAVMALTAACMMSDHQNDARRYMLESERVLRLRGLAKRTLSRKARMLHHIYTWSRIVGESTYVIHDYSSYIPVVQNLNLQQQQRAAYARTTENHYAPNETNTGHNARLDDFLRIESQHDSDLEIDEAKEAQKGLHDIHLEDSRDDPASMYLQIYGIPETWLSLVSQTTRLANVMDTLRMSNKETNITFQNALHRRASRLENMICAFAFKTASTNAVMDDYNDDANKPLSIPNKYMLQALNSALVIFFYRRVREVNPLILQSHVDDVIKALRDFDEALIQHNVIGPGTAWPAFIAGCEALAPHRREALLKRVQAGRAQAGMNSYNRAQQVMLEVWNRRTNATNETSSSSTQKLCTWVDVSRERDIWLMLC